MIANIVVLVIRVWGVRIMMYKMTDVYQTEVVRMKNKNTKCRIMINNYPSYELDKYTVVRATNHEFWFWGTYDKLDDAVKSAESIPNGYVLQTKGVR